MSFISPRRRGFTLVELLVVIAIIGVLVSMLLPALSAARFTSMRTKSAANFKGLVQGFLTYATDNRQRIPNSVRITTWGEAPGVAYMNSAFYGPGPQCDLMPVLDGYGLRPLTPHVFLPIYPRVGNPGNEYPPIAPTYWVTLGGYAYFPDYYLALLPSASRCASPTRVDIARPDHVMFQDFAGKFATLLPTGRPYSSAQPSSLNIPLSSIFFAEETPAPIHIARFDGAVQLVPGSTIQYIDYTIGYPYYIGHTQPQ